MEVVDSVKILQKSNMDIISVHNLNFLPTPIFHVYYIPGRIAYHR